MTSSNDPLSVPVDENSIPIVTFGRIPSYAQEVRRCLAPKYDAVHCVIGNEAALAEIPALLAGEAIVPTSGIGSNAERAAAGIPRRIPQVIALGGFIGQQEETELRRAVEERAAGAAWAKEVQWVRAVPQGQAGMPATGPPEAKVSAEWAISAMQEKGLEPGK